MHGLIYKQKLQEAHLEGCSINYYLSFLSTKKYISIFQNRKIEPLETNQEHKNLKVLHRAA